jgi:hypothetical protein
LNPDATGGRRTVIRNPEDEPNTDPQDSADWDETSLLGWEARAKNAARTGTGYTLSAEEAMLVAAFRAKSYLRFVAWIVGIVFFVNVALGTWIGVSVSNDTPTPRSTSICLENPSLC